MTAAHSYWSASRFEQRMTCPGSHVLEQGQPDGASVYAAEGTAAHQVLTWALQQEKDAADFIGTVIGIDERGRVITHDGLPEWTFTVDEDMAAHVQVTIDYVREVAGEHPVIVDTRVNYANYLGVVEDEAWGTLDVTILLPDEIVTVDLKYGMGVEVSAGYDVVEATGGVLSSDFATTYDVELRFKPNPQLALYGLGALNEYRDFADFRRVRLVISQPRITRKPSEYDLSVEELEAWGRGVGGATVQACRMAEQAYPDASDGQSDNWQATYLRPSEKGCKFCKAKATCPALRNEVAASVFTAMPASPEEFASAEVHNTHELPADASQWLSACLDKVDLIEDWCKAIRTETERRLLAGEGIPGYKLVQGKRGARAWTDPTEAETVMKSMRLKAEDMYDFKLISPTSAEKLAKANLIGPRQWPKLQSLITQPNGKPHVAPLADPRPALDIKPVADDFTDVTPSQADYAWLR